MQPITSRKFCCSKNTSLNEHTFLRLVVATMLKLYNIQHRAILNCAASPSTFYTQTKKTLCAINWTNTIFKLSLRRIIQYRVLWTSLKSSDDQWGTLRYNFSECPWGKYTETTALIYTDFSTKTWISSTKGKMEKTIPVVSERKLLPHSYYRRRGSRGDDKGT